MILQFSEAWFVVTFTGECPESRLIKGWQNVLDHIDREMGNKNDGWSVADKDCELHNQDCWTLLGSCYMNNDDERHTFDKAEFGYCVGLHIVRITEPVHEPVDDSDGRNYPHGRCAQCDCEIHPNAVLCGECAGEEDGL